MGAVVGEKVTRAIELAIAKKMPLVIVSCSGGARMMEGTISLMQLAKVSAALARLDEVRLPFISVLTDPTTGGVTASYAMLGDLNIAEPGALIGFAGPRVIEQTIRQKLPKGFRRSEFLLEHGFLDAMVHRKDLKTYISSALDFFHGAERHDLRRIGSVPLQPGTRTGFAAPGAARRSSIWKILTRCASSSGSPQRAVSVRAHCRNERQRLDRPRCSIRICARRGCARGFTLHRISSGSTSAFASMAEEISDADFAAAFTRVHEVDRRIARSGRLCRASDFFRVRDGHGLRAFRRGRRGVSPCSKSAWAGGWTRPIF